MYKIIEPEVPGGLGEQTIMDSTIHPPIIEKLHFEFQGWLGDDLIETFPCYLVTEKLRDGIVLTKLTGVSFDDVLISKSIEFDELYPNKKLPTFFWMKVNGKLNVDDFTITEDFNLLISDKVLTLLKDYNVNNATFEDYADATTTG